MSIDKRIVSNVANLARLKLKDADLENMSARGYDEKNVSPQESPRKGGKQEQLGILQC